MKTEYRNVNGHVEVFVDGSFFVSADTLAEAHKEMEGVKSYEHDSR